jgi:hypothetical protein
MNLKTRDSSVCISFGQSCSILQEIESRNMGREVRSEKEMRSSAMLMTIRFKIDDGWGRDHLL